MSAIFAALLSSMSQAALAVIARLVSRPLFEKIFERLIVAGVDYLADHTESRLIDDVAVIVKAHVGTKDQRQ